MGFWLFLIVVYFIVLEHFDMKRKQAKFDREWEEAHKDDFKEY
jgi:hypothetical protein